MGNTNLYEKLPVELLAGFYYHINRNIKQGILSDAMHHEIKLIIKVADEKGIPLDELLTMGAMVK